MLSIYKKVKGRFLSMKKIVLLLLVLLSCSVLGQQGDGGAYAREKSRRNTLNVKWHTKKITSDQYFAALYAPTKAGATSTIKKLKKAIAVNKSKISKSKSNSARKKYAVTIKLYGEHIKILEGILKRLEDEEYDEMCTDDFEKLLKNEKRLSRLTGSRINRSWPLTIEVYPNLYARNEDESENSSENETGKTGKKK